MSSLKPGEPIQFQAKKYVDALMGSVVGPDGKPVEGATIDVGYSSLLAQDARSNGLKLIVTNKNGEFGIDRLADGELAMTITAKGFRTGSFAKPGPMRLISWQSSALPATLWFSRRPLPIARARPCLRFL